MRDIEKINHFLQTELDSKGLECIDAVKAAEWLDSIGLLKDSKSRRGKPLRELLRQELILGQRQELNNRWFIGKFKEGDRSESRPIPRNTKTNNDSVTNSNSVERCRSKFRPEQIKVLFVGESAPAGGTLFYCANSNLFHATRQAFIDAFSEDCGEGKGFLTFFRDRGCYLDDLCLIPINKRDKSIPRSVWKRQRNQIRENNIPNLASRIRAYNPKYIVVVMQEITNCVQRAANEAGLSNIKIESLTFPAYRNERKEAYIRKLSTLLPRFLPI